MCEAEVVITVGVDENIDQMSSLIGITDELPMHLLIDNVPAFFHTIYNFYAYGLSRITILCPDYRLQKVQNILEQMNALQFVQYKDLIKLINPNIVTYTEQETALQRLCRMVVKGQQRNMMIQSQLGEAEKQSILEGNRALYNDQDYIESQNIIIVNGNSYIDVPPTIFLDVHRQSSATLTILHSQSITSSISVDPITTPILEDKLTADFSVSNSFKNSNDISTQSPTKQSDKSQNSIQSVIQTKRQNVDYSNGCVQIGQKLRLNVSSTISEEALSHYSVYDVSFFAYLNKKRLSDQEQDMIQYPLSVIHDDSEFTKYTGRPVGVVIASEILLYLGEKIDIQSLIPQTYINQNIVEAPLSNADKAEPAHVPFKLNLYEQLIIFLTEQKQLNFDCMHPRVQQYLTYQIEQQTSNKQHLEQYEIEKGLNKQMMLNSYQNKINSVLRENKDLDESDLRQQSALLDHQEHIFNKYIKDDYIDISSNNLITNTYKRRLKTTSFQFTNTHICTPESYDDIYNQIIQFSKKIHSHQVSQRNLQSFTSVNKINSISELGGASVNSYKTKQAIARNQSANQINLFQYELSQRSTQKSIDIANNNTHEHPFSGDQAETVDNNEPDSDDIDLETLSYPLDCFMGGMYNISNAAEYLYVCLAYQQFLFRSQQLQVGKSLKVQLLYKAILFGFGNKFVEQVFKIRHNFIPHVSFLDEINVENISNSTFYPRRQPIRNTTAPTSENATDCEECQILEDQQNNEPKSPFNGENKKINGTINNCIIYNNVEISQGVSLTNCIVFDNTQIVGDFQFTDCIIGKSCTFNGQGIYTSCVFKYLYTYKNKGANRKNEVLGGTVIVQQK